MAVPLRKIQHQIEAYKDEMVLCKKEERIHELRGCIEGCRRILQYDKTYKE